MSEQQKRLYRSVDERMVAGVCGGLGEYLNVDPTVIRILFFIIILVSLGSGLLLYFGMWLIIPEEPLSAPAPAPAPEPAAEPESEEPAE